MDSVISGISLNPTAGFTAHQLNIQIIDAVKIITNIVYPKLATNWQPPIVTSQIIYNSARCDERDSELILSMKISYQWHLIEMMTCRNSNATRNSMSLAKVLLALDFCDLTYSECLTTLLTSPEFIDKPGSASEILQVLISTPATGAETLQWALGVAQETYQLQMSMLSHKDSGFHFMAKTVSEECLKSFSIDTMASEMEKHAPDLWRLLKILLSADPRRLYKKMWAQRQVEMVRDTSSKDHERREFAEVELGDLDDDDKWLDMDSDEDEPKDVQEKQEEQFNALISRVTDLFCLRFAMQH